jgi:uncharacterized CHY-type Zn-finger protein
MENGNNDIVMRHCPHCDCICLISKTDIDSARAANKLVSISCHQCHQQFAIDGEQTKDRKIARPATLEFVTCPSCKKQVTLPDLPLDRSTVDLFCPFCESKIDHDGQMSEGESSHVAPVKSDLEKADLHPAREARQGPKSPTNYMPLYVLFVLCLGAYLFWAFETGQLPVETLPFDQWLKILQ